MDAIIRIKLSELNAGLVEHLKALFHGNDDVELTLTFDDKTHKYYDVLNRSKNDLENGHDLITFTMEELEAYSNNKLSLSTTD